MKLEVSHIIAILDRCGNASRVLLHHGAPSRASRVRDRRIEGRGHCAPQTMQ